MKFEAPPAEPSDTRAPIDKLLPHLEKVRATGERKWKACCPAHQDRTPSLSITEEHDGTVLLHCFAGCSNEDICSELGLKLRDLFVPDPEKLNGARHRHSEARLNEARVVVLMAQRNHEAGVRMSDEDWSHYAKHRQVLIEHGEEAGPDIRPPETRPIKWVRASEWVQDLKAPRWLVKGVLERATLTAMIGQWGGGKSAVALDLACRMACDLPWQGIHMPVGVVVYVAAEGQAGMQRRIAAWAKAHQMDAPQHLIVIPHAVLVGRPDQDVALREVLQEIRDSIGLPILLVVLDTLIRCYGLEDENSSSDMGNYANSIEANIIRPFDAACLVLHHPGHGDKSRGRGSSALPGAVDNEWLIKKGGNYVELCINKMKDGDDQQRWAWRLAGEEMELPGEDGLEQVTVVVAHEQEVEEGVVAGTRPKGGTKTDKALQVLEDMLEECVRELKRQGRPASQARVDRASWRDRYGFEHEKDGDISRRAFGRLVQRLVQERQVHEENGFCWPAGWTAEPVE